MCTTRILTQHGNTIINHCTECGMLNIWHCNLLLCFTPKQFEDFHSFTNQLDAMERLLTFPDGSERMILCTPNNDINFVFTESEWNAFNAAITEALYLKEVYKLID